MLRTGRWRWKPRGRRGHAREGTPGTWQLRAMRLYAYMPLARDSHLTLSFSLTHTHTHSNRYSDRHSRGAEIVMHSVNCTVNSINNLLQQQQEKTKDFLFIADNITYQHTQLDFSSVCNIFQSPHPLTATKRLMPN